MSFDLPIENYKVKSIHTQHNIGVVLVADCSFCLVCFLCSEGKGQLDCLGSILEKVTVHATDDSYQTTRERMTKAEEETRSRGAIVIKQGGPYVGMHTKHALLLFRLVALLKSLFNHV